MQSSQVPAIFPIAFAANAGSSFVNQIPQGSQIGITPGAASLNDGFPPVTFLALGSGGTPPWGRDMNGILNQLSGWAQWGSLGGPNYWNATLSASIGGYPKGAIVSQLNTLGNWWLCIVESNTTNPDQGGAGWIGFGIYGSARLITTSGAFTMSQSDGSIGLQRTTGLATSSTTLPANAINAQAFYIEDVIGNFSQYPCTITAPTGHNISGENSIVLNVDRQCARFMFYLSGLTWSVRL